MKAASFAPSASEMSRSPTRQEFVTAFAACSLRPGASVRSWAPNADSMETDLMRFNLWLLSGLVLILCAGVAPAGDYPEGKLLVEVAELAKPAPPNRFRVLDTRPKERYLAGHIPGAQWVDYDNWAKLFAAGSQVSAWDKIIGDLGIKHNASLVIYDDGWSKNAAHVWWILRYWGHEDVRLLNGGWHAWLSKGFRQERVEHPVEGKRIKLRPTARLAGMNLMMELVQDR